MTTYTRPCTTIPLSVLAAVTFEDYRKVSIVLSVLARRVWNGTITAKDIVFAKVLKYDLNLELDWIGVLAGGNPAHIEAVNEIAREELVAELEGE